MLECKCSDHHCSALVLLLQYNAGPCLETLQQPRVSAALTAGRAAPAAGLQICECVLRKIRTQLPGEENSAAARRGFCSTAAVTARPQLELCSSWQLGRGTAVSAGGSVPCVLHTAGEVDTLCLR